MFNLALPPTCFPFLCFFLFPLFQVLLFGFRSGIVTGICGVFRIFPFPTAIFGEITREQVCPAVFDDEQPLHQPVYQGAVVADDEDGAGEVVQARFEGFPGCHVEVVRWFVEKQQVRIRSDEFGEGKTAPFPATEYGYGLEHIVTAEQELREVITAFQRRPVWTVRLHLRQQIITVMQFLLVLVIKGVLHIVAQPHLSPIAFVPARQLPQQGRLAGTIRADNAQPFPAMERQGQVRIQGMVIGHGQVAGIHHRFTGAHDLAHLERDGGHIRFRRIHQFQFLQAFQPALRQARLGVLIPEPVYPRLLLLDEGILPVKGLLLLFPSQRLFFQPRIVIARVTGDHAALHFEDAFRQHIHHTPVMGDEHDSLRTGLDVLF